MALTFGFYNSVAHDRTYDSAQMSNIFDGIIRDGVMQVIGTQMFVTASSGMNVLVGAGRAWFNHTWTNIDSPLLVTLDASNMVLPRYDAIVLEINSSDDVRANSIKIVKGIPATTPLWPTLTNTDTVHQHALCEILVGAGVTSIVAGNINNLIGTVNCPFVTSPLTVVTTDTLLTQWAAQFVTWFQNMKNQLTTDAAGHLQLEINDINDLDVLLQAAVADLTSHITNIVGDDIAPGSISQMHLRSDASKVIRRKGGSSSNWATPGSTNYDVSAASLQIGSGQIDTGVNSMATIAFPTDFIQAPLVFAFITGTATDDPTTISAREVTTHQFNVRATEHVATAPYHQNIQMPVTFTWFAFGMVPIVD